MAFNFVKSFSKQSNKALRITFIYLLLSFCWIYFSDTILQNIEINQQTKTIVSVVKGWVFVIISALILFHLIRNALKEQLKMQGKLNESEDLHKLLFHKSMDAIIYSDPEGNIYSANEAACKILEYTEEELISLGRSAIVDDRDAEIIHLRSERKKKGYYSGEINFIKKSGEKFPVELTTNLYIDHNNKKRTFTIFRDITERKKNELEMRRWADAFQYCAHGMAIGDPVTNIILECNPALARLLGASIEEITGTSILSNYPASEHPKIKRFIVEADKNGRSYYESLMIRKDGTIYPVQVDVVCVKNKMDEIIYRVATIQDISGRKKAEEEFIKSELRFTRLVEEAPEAIFIQKDYKFFYVNQAAADLLGYSSKDKMIGQVIINHVHPDYRKTVHNRITLLNQSLQSVPLIEQLMIKCDGTPVWVESSAIPFSIQEVNGALVFLRNINDRKQTEAELMQNRDLIKLAGEMAKIGGWEFDVSTGEGTWTEEVARIHEVEADDITNEKFGFSFYEGENKIKIELAILECIKSGIPYDIELEMKTAVGNHKWVRTKGKPIYENGKIVKLRGSFQDITDIKLSKIELEKHKNHLEDLVNARTAELDELNKKLQAEIEKELKIEFLLRSSLNQEKQLNEMKGEFISTVSHEFRTPLTSMLTSTELIERNRDKWDEKKFSTHIERVKNSIHYLTKLIDDILLINKSDSNRIEFKPLQLDVEVFCTEITSAIKDDLRENQNLVYNFSSTQKKYNVDENLLRSILTNLLSNAIKYSPGGGDINFAASGDNNHLKLTVEDSGIGIPKEDFPRMFDTFHRAENAKDIKGTGLGLSIVKRCIDLHNGNINVESTLGKGTKFTVTIPFKHTHS